MARWGALGVDDTGLIWSGQQVMAFSRPLADNKMLELIKRGRSRATMMSPGGATPEGPEQGISWAGAALRI